MTGEKMIAEVKAEWVAALRGGNYAQGDGYLRVDDAFCCLGVLCDLAVRNNIIPEPVAAALMRLPDGKVYEYGRPCTCSTGDVDCNSEATRTYLPDAVVAWAGLQGRGGDRGFGKSSLTALNDSGTPFAEIADIIEAEF